MGILKNDAQRIFIAPLETHGWKVKIEQESPADGSLVISAERGIHRRLLGFVYSCATSNTVYRRLAAQVDHIFFRGQPYNLQAYAYGLDKPVSSDNTFHNLLLQWNQASAEGKFTSTHPNAEPVTATRSPDRALLAEDPLQAIWFRLRQFQSLALAKKLVRDRAARASVTLGEDVVRSKAEGVAYALRNAADYYQSKDVHNLSQRILNLYYGSMAFVMAEMLAAPAGPKQLAEIEESTKQGHGLFTLDGVADGLEHLVVGVIDKGFFPAWIKTLGLNVDGMPSKKPRRYDDLQKSPLSWITVERLFASIPEVADLYDDIFEQTPRWVTPVYDQSANAPLSFDKREPATRTYVLFIDNSARLTQADISQYPGPLSEISAVPSSYPGGHFRVAVDHPGKQFWWEVLPIHHSPFKRDSLILPIFESVGYYRAICFVLLYALSIVVRYRPSVWRQAQEGERDYLRVLTEAFLAVVERMLPDQFLSSITDSRVSARQPSGFF